MSSRAKKMEKDIKNTLKFPQDAYFNFLTSYAICSYILNRKGNVKHITKVHNHFKKCPEEIKKYITGDDWLKELSELYGVEYDLTGRIVLVQGDNNMFFLIADEDGNVYTTREDGVGPARSLEEAKENETIFRMTGENE